MQRHWESKISAIIVIIFILTAVDLHSQVKAFVRDTTIPRGAIYLVPIYGSVTGDSIGKLSIQFNFNSFVIDVKSAIGGAAFAMQEAKPLVTFDFKRLDSAIMTVTSNNIRQVTNSIICLLEVEGLAGPDTISLLLPQKAYINDSVAQQTEFYEGKIKVSGSPVFQEYREAVSQNYPNPFYEATDIPFTISETTKIRSYIYNLSGMFLCSLTGSSCQARAVFFAPDGSPLPDPENYLFGKGNYRLNLWLDPSFFTAGVYYLAIETGKGIYISRFILIK